MYWAAILIFLNVGKYRKEGSEEEVQNGLLCLHDQLLGRYMERIMGQSPLKRSLFNFSVFFYGY